jgi:hypothetical protein
MTNEPIAGESTASARRPPAHWIALMAAVAGHQVNMMVSFETITSATLFWLILAMIGASARLDSQPRGQSPNLTKTAH